MPGIIKRSKAAKLAQPSERYGLSDNLGRQTFGQPALTSRRSFIGGAAALLGAAAPIGAAWAEMAKHPLAGTILPKWEKGHFRISMLYTGRSEAALLVFPDGTSMLADCGDYRRNGNADIPFLPTASRRAGEQTARYVLRENPNGKKVDYFLLTHYHSDHAGTARYGAGRGANGKYSLAGIGQAMDYLDFGVMIDRSWPDINDPAPRPNNFDEDTVGHVKEVYAEAERRGIKVEKFRLEKGSDQIRMLHGGGDGFSFTPLCSNGLVLRRDGSLLDLSTIAGKGGTPRAKFGENALSIGFILSLGDFRYYAAGDFSGFVKGADGKRKDIEEALAAECPQVDVAKANHHGHHTHHVALVNALKARLILTGVWHDGHMNLPTMRRLATAKWPCLYAPGLFPASRRKADAKESWLKDIAPESFAGAHAVVDVQPDGKAYRLMMVTAADETFRILGAYDFKTSKKDS